MRASSSSLHWTGDAPNLNGPITVNNGDGNQINVDFGMLLTVNSAVSGTGGLLFNFAGAGVGVILMTGESTYTGGTAIHGNGDDAVVLSGGDNRLPTGTALSINSVNALVLGTTAAAMNQTVASFGGNNAAARVVGANATASTLAFDSRGGVGTTFLGTVGLSGGHANTNNLALVMGGSGAQVLTNASYYTGGTTINGGTLVFGSKAAKPTTGSLTINAGGAVGLGVDTAGVAYWTTDDITALWTNNLAGFPIDDNARVGIHTGVEDINYGRDLSTRGLVKTGAFALTLTGSNTYTGGTEIYGGALIVGANALGSGHMVLGGGTLSNAATRTISDSINLSAASTIGTAAGTTLTISGTVTNTGALTKSGQGTLEITGAALHGGSNTIAEGAMDIGATGSLRSGADTVVGTVANSPAVLNVQGGSVSGRQFYVGNGSVGVTGIVTQASGRVDLSGLNGLLLGNGPGAVGIYTLADGILNANANMGTAGMGITLGVNVACTGVLNVTGGALQTRRLDVGRDRAENYAAGLYNQAAGTAVVGDLCVGGGQNQRSEFRISGGTFTATNFLAMAHRTGGTGILYFARGSTVNLGAFPTARGAGSYAELTLDGAVVRPLAATNAYMSGLHKAFVSTNGAIFDVATGRDITIAQSFEDAAGQAGVLVKRGAGTLSLSGTSNAFTGVTTVEEGMLSANTQGSAGASPLIVVSNGATYQANMATMSTLTNDFRLAGGNATLRYWQNNARLNLAGQITIDGGGRITTYNAGTTTNAIEKGIQGTGPLNLVATASNNGDGVFLLKGQSSYSGDTVVDTLNARYNRTVLDTDDALPTATTLRIKTGTTGAGLGTADARSNLWSRFVLNGYNQEVAGIASTSQYAGQTNSIVGGSAVLSTLTVNNAIDHTFAGRIGGGDADENNLALVKRGIGTLTLSFDGNSYAGATTVEAGKLAIGGTHVGGGMITVKSGGTLGGTGTVGAATIEEGGILAAGNSVGTLRFSDTVTILGSLAVENQGALADLVQVTGDVTLGLNSVLDLLGALNGTSSYTILTFTGARTGVFGNTADATAQNYRVDYNDNDITLTVIPEPSALALFVLSSAAALLVRRRRLR